MKGRSKVLTVTAEVMSKYDALVQEASKAYLAGQYQKALAIYNNALVKANAKKMDKMVICVLKYMVASCLYQSNKFEDLSEVVVSLQSLDKSLKDKLPAIYCLLAQAHCKLHRFDHALDVLYSEAESVFNSNSELETFFIPGTKIVIEQNDKNSNSWQKVKEECSTWHIPDAICSLPECNNITKPYVTPNRNIFISDPAFNGMINVSCNNKTRPCTLKFHQTCWRFKKDLMYPIQKVSDKDILGDACFTPNCMNDSELCVISSIEIIGPNGALKTHITNSHLNIWCINKHLQEKKDEKIQDKNQEKVHDKNVSKGAIKKVKPPVVASPTPKKSENHITQPKYLIPPVHAKRETRIHKPAGYYDRNQIIVVKKEVLDTNIFSNEPPEIAGRKNFIFSLFYHYIKDDVVKVKDVFAKFSELNEHLFLENFDIMKFLLDTNKFDLLTSNVPKSVYPALQTQETNYHPSIIPCETRFVHVTQKMSNSTLNNRESVAETGKNEDNTHKNMWDKGDIPDLDDVYYELLDDDEDDYIDCVDVESSEKINSIQNKTSKENGCDYLLNRYREIYNCEEDYGASGGTDAPSGPNSYNKSLLPHFSLDESVQQDDNQQVHKNAESEKLMEYVSQLQIDIEKITNEKETLKQNLEAKDKAIERLEKDGEELATKMGEWEKVYDEFQKKYQDMQEDNSKIKQEMIDLIQEKEKFKEELQNSNNPEKKRLEIMHIFQDEFRILQNCINEEWEEEVKTLKKSLEKDKEIKMTLVKKCLNYQFMSAKTLLNGHLEHCGIALEVINKINTWMEKTTYLKNFTDASEWTKRLNNLQQIAADHQAEFFKLVEELNISSSDEDEIINLELNLPQLPSPPKQSLSEILNNALTIYYQGQCQALQSMVTQQQQQSSQQPPGLTPMVTYPQSYQYSYSADAIRMGLLSNYAPYQSYNGTLTYPQTQPYIQPPSMITPQFFQQFFQDFGSKANSHKEPVITVPDDDKEAEKINENQSKTLIIEKLKDMETLNSRSSINNVLEEQVSARESEKMSGKASDTASDKVVIKEMSEDEAKSQDNMSQNNVSEDETNTAATAIDEKEEAIVTSSINDSKDDVVYKINKMKQAFQAIALNIKEKSAAMKSEQNKDSVKQLSPGKTDVRKEVLKQQAALRTESNTNSPKLQTSMKSSESSYSSKVNDALSETASITSKASTMATKKKKCGVDQLVKVLEQKFPGLLEVDYIEIINQIRLDHNNKLTGLPVSQILKEAEGLVPSSQRFHILRYLLNDASKSNHSDTAKGRGSTPVLSAASSCNSLNKIDMNVSKKKNEGFNKSWIFVQPPRKTQFFNDGEVECSICMCTIQDEDCYTLTCEHTFHYQCVKKWLKTDRSCPNCRVLITEDDEFPPLPS